MNIRDKPAFETGTQSVFERCDFFGMLVRSQDDLFVLREKFVEGMEEFFLRTGFFRKKLDIVDNEHVHVAVVRSKLRASVARIDFA